MDRKKKAGVHQLGKPGSGVDSQPTLEYGLDELGLASTYSTVYQFTFLIKHIDRSFQTTVLFHD